MRAGLETQQMDCASCGEGFFFCRDEGGRQAEEQEDWGERGRFGDGEGREGRTEENYSLWHTDVTLRQSHAFRSAALHKHGNTLI